MSIFKWYVQNGSWSCGEDLRVQFGAPLSKDYVSVVCFRLLVTTVDFATHRWFWLLVLWLVHSCFHCLLFTSCEHCCLARPLNQFLCWGPYATASRYASPLSLLILPLPLGLPLPLLRPLQLRLVLPLPLVEPLNLVGPYSNCTSISPMSGILGPSSASRCSTSSSISTSGAPASETLKIPSRWWA